MKCAACRIDNPVGAQFCSNCGTSLGAHTTSGDWAGNDQPQRISFTNAVSLGFNRYIKFSGRSTRAEYWWWVLFLVLADVLLSIVDVMIGTYDYGSSNGLISGLFSLGTLIPSFALGARRLHDINRTGWWQLMWLSIVPAIVLFVGAIELGVVLLVPAIVLFVPAVVLFVWSIKLSDDGPNRYGPKPWTADLHQP